MKSISTTRVALSDAMATSALMPSWLRTALSSPLGVIYQIQNLSKATIAVADKVIDTDFDLQSLTVTLPIGAEIPPGTLPHLTTINPSLWSNSSARAPLRSRCLTPSSTAGWRAATRSCSTPIPAYWKGESNRGAAEAGRPGAD